MGPKNTNKLSPTSSANSIPSSATGDIILHTDKPAPSNNGPKKGIIIAMVAAATVLILGLTFFLIASNNPSNNSTANNSSSSEADLAPVSLGEVVDSLYNLSNLLIGNNQETAPNFNTNLNNWQITKIANSASVSSEKQLAYADDLLVAQEVFSNNLRRYRLQNPDTDLTNLTSNGNLLSDRAVASAIYIRGGGSADEIVKAYLENPEGIDEIMNTKFDTNYGVFDPLSVEIISTTVFFYQSIIERLRIFSENGCIKNSAINETCVSRLRSDYDAHPDLARVDTIVSDYATIANDAFPTLLDGFPGLLSDINTSLGEL